MLRAKIATDEIITAWFYARDDETLQDASGDITVTVFRDSGEELTGGVATKQSEGVYQFTLQDGVHLTEYGTLLVSFTGEVDTLKQTSDQYVKVVGKRFFSLAALRNEPGMGDNQLFPNEVLRFARDVAEDFVEDFTEAAWVYQALTEVYDGENDSCLFVGQVPAREILGVILNGVVQDTTGWTLSEAGLLRTKGVILTAAPEGQNVEVNYVHGYREPKGDLVRASIRLARYLSMSSETSIPDRARMMQTEWGLFHLDVANKDHPTGLPEVDAVLARYHHEQPVTIV